jgi:alpha-L-fucosidase
VAESIQETPWQTCTCIGDWHYSDAVYAAHSYKPAVRVVRMLMDVVSKNGNLLLNVPVTGAGTIDDDERAIVEEIGAWIAVNGEAVFDTVPWRVFGEGPAADSPPEMKAQGFNESAGMAETAEDIRYTAAEGAVFATVMDTPGAEIRLRRLGLDAGLLDGSVSAVTLLRGGVELDWRLDGEALVVEVPDGVRGDGVRGESGGADGTALDRVLCLKISTI